MAEIDFLLNQTVVTESVPVVTPLLDVIRPRLTGCKEVCREGDCGACLLLVGKLEQGRVHYRPAAACLLPLGAVAGAHVVTIEGLSSARTNPIQQALIEQGGIQCGFCTPGIVVALTGFFLNAKAVDVDEALDAVAGNLCRCTGYAGIKRAVRQLCERFDSPLDQRLQYGIDLQWLPPYFAGVAEQLTNLTAAEEMPAAENALLIAGGTDLLVHGRLAGRPAYFLPAAGGDEAIRREGTQCRIAASATIEQLRTSALLQEDLPSLADDEVGVH